MFGVNPRDLRRLMKQFGIRMEELRVERVRLELDDGRVLLIEKPQAAMIMRQKAQPPMLYIVGEPVEVEEKPEEEAAPKFTEEDVMLVAEQAGVPPEEARKALEETGGDIAAAILKLQGEG